MSYDLAFHPKALDEWRQLDATVRHALKRKLAERLQSPRVPAAKLAGHPDRYKIKLMHPGYRLVYEVRDAQVLVLVVAIGKRERGAAYAAAARR